MLGRSQITSSRTSKLAGRRSDHHSYSQGEPDIDRIGSNRESG
jgi:hypothetical protein